MRVGRGRVSADDGPAAKLLRPRGLRVPAGRVRRRAGADVRLLVLGPGLASDCLQERVLRLRRAPRRHRAGDLRASAADAGEDSGPGAVSRKIHQSSASSGGLSRPPLFFEQAPKSGPDHRLGDRRHRSPETLRRERLAVQATGEVFLGQGVVVERAGRVGCVVEDRLAEARRLGQADVLADAGFEEMGLRPGPVLPAGGLEEVLHVAVDFLG